MFNEQVLRRLMKSNRDDPFNSYGEHVKMTGGIRYGKHPLPQMDFEPDNLYTGDEMYEDYKPRMVSGGRCGCGCGCNRGMCGGRLIGGYGARRNSHTSRTYGQLVNGLEQRGGSLKSFGKSLSRGLKSVGKVVAPIARDVVMPVVKDFATKQGRKLLEQQLARFAIQDALPVAEEVAPLMLAAGRRKPVKSSKRLGCANRPASDKRCSRNLLVKNLMREQGLTLPQASKMIKDQNLPY